MLQVGYRHARHHQFAKGELEFPSRFYLSQKNASSVRRVEQIDASQTYHKRGWSSKLSGGFGSEVPTANFFDCFGKLIILTPFGCHLKKLNSSTFLLNLALNYQSSQNTFKSLHI